MMIITCVVLDLDWIHMNISPLSYIVYVTHAQQRPWEALHNYLLVLGSNLVTISIQASLLKRERLKPCWHAARVSC